MYICLRNLTEIILNNPNRWKFIIIYNFISIYIALYTFWMPI